MSMFCEGCGRSLRAALHDGCAGRLPLDPPRYCGACGFRLDVQVYPDRAEITCRECRRRARRSQSPPGGAEGVPSDQRPRAV
ncbi:MAG: hypothetical protein ACRD0K_00155 [Egibacteraceae bacterium]